MGYTLIGVFSFQLFDGVFFFALMQKRNKKNQSAAADKMK